MHDWIELFVAKFAAKSFLQIALNKSSFCSRLNLYVTSSKMVAVAQI